MEGITMAKKTYVTVLYVVLSVAALVLASGGPVPWGGGGG
jgi:hypothetical protein